MAAFMPMLRDRGAGVSENLGKRGRMIGDRQ